MFLRFTTKRLRLEISLKSIFVCNTFKKQLIVKIGRFQIKYMSKYYRQMDTKPQFGKKLEERCDFSFIQTKLMGYLV